MYALRNETSVNFYQTTWRNNPEDSHLHNRRRENLKSRLVSCSEIRTVFKNSLENYNNLFPKFIHLTDSLLQHSNLVKESLRRLHFPNPHYAPVRCVVYIDRCYVKGTRIYMNFSLYTIQYASQNTTYKNYSFHNTTAVFIYVF
jgi:hypothetical protein